MDDQAIQDAAAAAGRPTQFPMRIQGGMLEALGINMYTSIGKCLVEFIANAYDADAAAVDVSIPYARIEASRQQARREAREAADSTGADRFNVLLAPLPDDVVIEVRDGGHGMSPEDVREKFMSINRKRRADASGAETRNMSEGGRRYVMGRKGLGKLAGFGAAEVVEIETKRAGDTFSTVFTMEFDLLRNSDNLTDVPIPARYVEDQGAERHGTTVRLRRLKCDAVRQSAETIAEVVSSAFYGISPADFAISINGKQLAEAEAAYEFIYAPDAGADGFSRCSFEVEDVGKINFDYLVKFRARSQDPNAPTLAFGSLPAAKRGARIYCNNRLAAGPSLLALKTGMHNFYATDYLECIVRADGIDRGTIDFVNTNRTQLREDNEVVQKLIEAVTAVMAQGIVRHAAWKEADVEGKLTTKVRETPALRWIEGLPKSQRDAARKVLKAVAVVHDLDSPEFAEVAPNLMNAVNANDVLIRLIELRSDPRSIERVAESLVELGKIERKDVLKLYRGRRSAIEGLRTLIEQGEAAKRGDPKTEKDLHALLKDRPWLVRPEYSTFTASDVRLTTTLSKIAQELGIDEFAPPHIDADKADATRPDLVFLLGNTPDQPHVITVVELKTPTDPMTADHLEQLKRYMRDIQDWIRLELKREVQVHGMLVGKMPESTTRAVRQRDLLAEIRERGPATPWEVMGLQAMLERTRMVHIQMIENLAREEEEDNEA